MQEWACLDLSGQHPWCRAACFGFLRTTVHPAPVPLGETRPALAVSTGRNPSLHLFPGVSAPAKMLGLLEEDDWSFVQALPWRGGGSEIKG